MKIPGLTKITCPCILCIAFLFNAQVKAELQNEFRKDSIAPAAQRLNVVDKDAVPKISPRSFDRNHAGTGIASSVPVQVATESTSQQGKRPSQSGSTGGEQSTRLSESSKSSRSLVEPSSLSRSSIQGKDSPSGTLRPTDSAFQRAKTQGDSPVSDQQQRPKDVSSAFQSDSLPADLAERPTRAGRPISRHAEPLPTPNHAGLALP
jgi:hypothetical protein